MSYREFEALKPGDVIRLRYGTHHRSAIVLAMPDCNYVAVKYLSPIAGKGYRITKYIDQRHMSACIRKYRTASVSEMAEIMELELLAHE